MRAAEYRINIVHCIAITLLLTSSHQRHIVLVMTEKVLLVRVTEELHRAFKVKCVQEGKNMNSVLTTLIEGYVKESKPKSKTK